MRDSSKKGQAVHNLEGMLLCVTPVSCDLQQVGLSSSGQVFTWRFESQSWVSSLDVIVSLFAGEN